MQIWAQIKDTSPLPTQDQSEGTGSPRRLFIPDYQSQDRDRYYLFFLHFLWVFFYFSLFLSFPDSVSISGSQIITSFYKSETLCAGTRLCLQPPRVPMLQTQLPSGFQASLLSQTHVLGFGRIFSPFHNLRYSIKCTYLSIYHLYMLYLYLIVVSGSPFCHRPSSQFLYSIIFAVPQILSPSLFLSPIFLQKPITTSFSEKSEALVQSDDIMCQKSSAVILAVPVKTY